MATETSALTGVPIEEQGATTTTSGGSNTSAITGQTATTTTPTSTATDATQATTTQNQTSALTPVAQTTQTPQEAVAPIAESTSSLTGSINGVATDKSNQTETTQTSALTVPMTKVIEATVPSSKYIDPEIQTKMDEIADKQRRQFIESQVAQSQAQTDSFSQKMAQEGYAGTGVKNSLLAMLSASNNASMTAGLQDLANESLNNEFKLAYEGFIDERNKEDQLVEASRTQNLAIFSSLQGNPQEQINYAKMMQEIDPTNPFWNQFSDSEFASGWVQWQQKDVLARESEMNGYANELIFNNWDTLNTTDGMMSKFDEFKNIKFENTQKLGASSNSWYNTTSLENINTALESLGSSPISSKDQITDFQTINDIYAMSEYRKAIKSQTALKVTEHAREVLAEMGDSLDPTELELLKTYSNTFMDVLGDEVLNFNGMTGTFSDLFTDQNTSFLSFDWDGVPYDSNYNAETIMQRAEAGDIVALRNQRLNELWKAYLKNIPEGATTMTPQEFEQLPEIQAISENVNNSSILRSSDANTFISNGAVDGGFLNKIDISQIIDGAPEQLVTDWSGDNKSKADAIQKMNASQLLALSNSEEGKKQIQILMNSGLIPVVTGEGGNMNYYLNSGEYEDNISYSSKARKKVPNGSVKLTNGTTNYNGDNSFGGYIALPNGDIYYSSTVDKGEDIRSGQIEFMPISNPTAEPILINLNLVKR